ncbi:response regulator transcription factor [Aliikangiella coralliicola]|uniref:Response regulator transcription factor n=1 Tax=Aliikangiella coralliicola TaxID=2592383 RepID=A0A545UCJ1_9GAMM|nr:response regulator transcription factor [Aliikangiella coralliicola]TQV87184.1 response regulator transcription factor [Aliikangiella coralliicola]
MSASQNILLVEDDQKLAELLRNYFEEFGFVVELVNTGLNAAEQIIKNAPDLVILDLMLPHQDGLSICRSIRETYSGKILMLTATSDDMDQVAALEMGADDFVQKPVQPRVLLARIRMLLRRSQHQSSDEQSDSATKDKVVNFGKLSINRSLQRCKLEDEVVPLTPSEFSLLCHLAEHPDRVLSREELLESLSGLEYDGLNRTVDNKIAQLRKKLKDDAHRPLGIITVRGKGYMFVPDYW